MASLPLRVSQGMVAIYGSGSINGIEFNVPSGLQWGRVNSLYDEFGEYSLGQNVLFNIEDSQIMNYQNVQYFIVPQDKITGTEDEILPP